ncbi:MAG: putative toxin-antitoxin system toxin component, PIN family [Candidatus Omnitrophica bacterium]|nr:putative toxin-antitoxin system toxin component, PIN family [Candidatus Omnitrophota bacterium]
MDSNVLIAAFATRGLCQAVMELCLEHHELILSRDVLEEVHRNLREKIKLPAARAGEVVSFLKSRAKVISPEPLDPRICSDPGDVKVLGAAVAGKADLLVTGDKELLSIAVVRGIPVVSPREFWTRMRK